MDREQNLSENLLDRENKLIADILSAFRSLVLLGTENVDNIASTGQAGYNSMAIEITMNGLIKSTEDLLELTRQLRELWVVGPLKKPGEGDEEAAQGMRQDATVIFDLLNRMRAEARQRLAQQAQGAMVYVSGPTDGIPARLVDGVPVKASAAAGIAAGAGAGR
ncbi:hypothetical protein B0T22DRAFT_472792 [Podospora appendiculata]|uniref:Mediator of RNA polymerase II transcription subunit 22 n=1 Tax=Podospora appendiculata TaxID=314037 RepID=A0AAE1C7M3_9PEZI|nr:hypothetical protein B0T22DRAFT_472792 [Podospora appendiculata]